MGSKGGEEDRGWGVREGKRTRRESSPCCDTSLRIVTAPTHWTGAPLKVVSLYYIINHTRNYGDNNYDLNTS